HPLPTVRAAVRLLLALLLLALLGLSGAARAAPVSRVDSIGITVGDMERALAFYTGVLPFEVISETEVHGDAYERLFGVFGMRARIVRLRLGDEEIELIDYLAPEGRPVPPDSRSNDEWFQHVAMIVSDMDAAYARLRQHNVQHASTGPQRLPDWNPNAGGIEAFYFKNPDGNHLEILEFPPDKGDRRWHEPTDALFLGIDHTAIVVRDTDASVGFFEDALGLQVRGTSENYGPEQERLNNVFGARLLITSLGAPAGPAVEFLDYVAPATGRPMPIDTRANDLWHWQIRMETADLQELEKTLRAAGAAFVSPGIVEMPDDALALGRALMVRDPVGHAVLLMERPH
ncbi:MAG TPA: VOC family protein, partial [Steroidobacteraceae bacterium]|nr:VOC family protein [Steroidobacteraceae bacterium]